MTEERKSDKDERAEALEIAERWKSESPFSIAPNRALGKLARALLAAEARAPLPECGTINAAGEVPARSADLAKSDLMRQRSGPLPAAPAEGPTPRTDALPVMACVIHGQSTISLVDREEYRRLERELAEAQRYDKRVCDALGMASVDPEEALNVIDGMREALSSRSASLPSLEERAKALFLKNAKGWNHRDWDELHDDTKQLWRDEARKRAPVSAIQPREVQRELERLAKWHGRMAKVATDAVDIEFHEHAAKIARASVSAIGNSK